MNATFIQQAILQLKDSIFMHVRHRTLLHYVGEPVVNENQLFFLLFPFLNGDLWGEEIQYSASITGVVHAALFEHDKIQEQDATSKEQQLTVLSGDFYSGRYYELLSLAGNLRLIQKLSQGVIERCEQEAQVYELKNFKIEDALYSWEVIETALIRTFYECYEFAKYTPIMTSVLKVKRIKKELELMKSGRITYFGYVMLKSYKYDELVVKMEQNIQQEKQRIQQELSVNTYQEELILWIEHIVNAPYNNFE